MYKASGYSITNSQISPLSMGSHPDDFRMLFPNAAALTQLVSDDKPIVGGACYAPTLNGIAAWIKCVQISMQYTQRLVQVDRMGLPFCLIKREGFDRANRRLEKPLFYFKVDTEISLMKGEDAYFFDKIRQIGYKPWIDLRAQVIHLKSVGITAEGSMLDTFG